MAIKVKEPVQQATEIPEDQKQIFEQWRCEVLYNREKKEYYPSRLQLLRNNVKITSRQATTLNQDIVNRINTFCELYFYPGQYDSYPGQRHETPPTLSFGK